MIALIRALTLLVAVPLVVFNVASGFVGFVWLLLEGAWRALISGAMAAIAGPFLISFGVLPGVAIGSVAFLSPSMTSSPSKWTWPFLLTGTAWPFLILTAWCIGAFHFLLNDTSAPRLPLLIWAYAIATGAPTFLAQKEVQADPGSPVGVTTFFLQCGTISLMVAYLVDGGALSLSQQLWAFVPWMLPAIAFQLFFVARASRPVPAQ